MSDIKTYSHKYENRDITFQIIEATEFIPNNLAPDYLIDDCNSFLVNEFEKNNVLEVNSRYFLTKNLESYKKKSKRIGKTKEITLLNYNSNFYEDKNEYIILFNSEFQDETLVSLLNTIEPLRGNFEIKKNLLRFCLITADKDLNLSLLLKNEKIVAVEKNLYTIPYILFPKVEVSRVKNEDIKQNIVYEKIKLHEAQRFIDNNFAIKSIPIIGLIDNGVDFRHPDLRKSFDIEKSKTFIENDINQLPEYTDYHGTECAGILSATKSHPFGLDGVGKGSKLISYRVVSGNNYDSIYISAFALVEAIYTAGIIDGCDIINCSWSIKYESEILKHIISYVTKNGRSGKGGIIVFSAGNENKKIQFPKDINDVITVASSDLNFLPKNKGTWKSNYGDNVLIAAPGVSVITTDFPGTYGRNNLKHQFLNKNYENYAKFWGTSASTPIISGAISILLKIEPELSLKDIKHLLKISVTKFKETPNYNYGSGVINIFKLVTNLKTIKRIQMEKKAIAETNSEGEKRNENNDLSYSSTIVLEDLPDDKYQFIYGSDLYRTSFDVYAHFAYKHPKIESVSDDNLEDKTKCIITAMELSVLNYKGILDIGIYGIPTLEVKEYEILGKKIKAAVLELNVQAIVSGTSKYSQKVKIINPNNEYVCNEIPLIVNRSLVPLAGNLEAQPIVNGVFDDEYFYRDGLQYIKRFVTEVPEKNYIENLNPTYPDGILVKDRPATGSCRTAIVQIKTN